MVMDLAVYKSVCRLIVDDNKFRKRRLSPPPMIMPLPCY